MANTSIDDAPSSHRSGRLPNFLLIGAMKSGTTSLATYLRSHPEAFVPVREIHFFDYKFSRGLEWYSKWFKQAGSELIVGEASPSYMYVEQAVDLIASTIPQAKLLAILRNPVDRAYSQYWKNQARGREDLEFADAIEAEPERLATGDLSVRLRSAYLDRGRYLRQLERVWGHFPREATHVVFLEEMKLRPRDTYAEVCRFLGVDPSFVPATLGQASAASKRARSRRLQKVALRFGRKVEKRVWKLNRVPWKYPPMDPDLRAELMGRFEEDNAALSAALGKDLASLWK